VALSHRDLRPGTQSGEHLASAPAGRLVRGLVLALVVIPFGGVIAAIALAWRHGVGEAQIGLLAGMYVLTTAAITVGYHRYFAHRAFHTGAASRIVLAIAGSMAGQGPVIYWSATHRHHHHHADRPGDPHSPHLYGPGVRNQLRGLWHAHTGWLFGHQFTDCARYAPDLLRDAALCRVNQLYLVWVFLGLLIPTVAGAMLTPTWMGALNGFIWGGLARIFLLQHTTFSINSICHVFGRRPFDTADRSTNNFWLAVISFGEAWHNNHHAFPRSAVFGLTWWQVDAGSLVIRILEAAGIVWNVRAPGRRARKARATPG
jgi:stearoyl-CoA desaturase (delta-9 desaturase)